MGTCWLWARHETCCFHDWYGLWKKQMYINASWGFYISEKMSKVNMQKELPPYTLRIQQGWGRRARRYSEYARASKWRSEKNPCFVINLRREHKIYFREWEEVIKDNNKKMKNYLDFYKIGEWQFAKNLQRFK